MLTKFRKMKKIIIGVIALCIIAITYSVLTMESIHSLEGDFQKLGYVRNENNTGPVHRVYAFTVEDSLWNTMKKHLDLLPHTKYGTTEVFYFLPESSLEVVVSLNAPKLNEQAEKKYIAYGVKNGQGKIIFKKNPFFQ